MILFLTRRALNLLVISLVSILVSLAQIDKVIPLSATDSINLVSPPIFGMRLISQKTYQYVRLWKSQILWIIASIWLWCLCCDCQHWMNFDLVSLQFIK